MTEKDFNDFLDSVSKEINVPKGAINKDNEKVKSFISFYENLTGKKIGEGNCKDCILDALFELKTKTPNQLKTLLMEKNYLLKKNRLVGFGGSHYTKDNMTDAIAFEMVRSNRSNAAHFENPEQLLSDYDKSLSNKSVQNDAPVKVVAPGKREEKSVTAPVAVAPENLTVSVTEKTPVPETVKTKTFEVPQPHKNKPGKKKK